MDFNSCISFAVIVLCSGSVYSKAVSSDKGTIHSCMSKNPALQECMMEVGNSLFKELNKGHKNLGIPVMDPMFVPKMQLLSGKKLIHLNLINSTQTGLGSSVIKSIKADPEHYKFEIDMVVPKYVIEGTYDVNAKIAMLPIVGKGPSVITLNVELYPGFVATFQHTLSISTSFKKQNDLKSKWIIEGAPLEKGGKKYFKVKSFKVTLAPKRMTFLLKDLFNGNKQLGETMNLFMNENWEEVFKQLKPLMETAFSELLLKLSSNVFEKVPYTNMFPDMV